MYTYEDNRRLQSSSTVQFHASDLQSSIPGHRRSGIWKLSLCNHAAAGRRHNLNTEVRCAVDSFLHEPVELADYGNIRLDHRAVIAVELDIKWRWKDFTWAFIFANIKTDVH